MKSVSEISKSLELRGKLKGCRDTAAAAGWWPLFRAEFIPLHGPLSQRLSLPVRSRARLNRQLFVTLTLSCPGSIPELDPPIEQTRNLGLLKREIDQWG